MIIQTFILAIIVSLACATIYASETAEISKNDSSNDQDSIHISESNDHDGRLNTTDPVHSVKHVDLPAVYV